MPKILCAVIIALIVVWNTKIKSEAVLVTRDSACTATVSLTRLTNGRITDGRYSSH